MKPLHRWSALWMFLLITGFLWLPALALGADADPVESNRSGEMRPEQNAPDPSESQPLSGLMEKADSLLKNAESHYEKGNIRDFDVAANLYEQAASQQPENYEANWKTAKACRLYGEEARKRKIAYWEDICAEYGKKGMHYAQKAIELSSGKVEGYFYYGLCVGTYSDGVGIFTALREGLKDKVQTSLQKAYSIDKYYDQGGPIIALGRFWQVVPWPYTDDDRAMELYREIEQTKYFNDRKNVEVRIYMAEILMGRWGGDAKKEAGKLLAEVPRMTDDPYWIERAQTMRKEL